MILSSPPPVRFQPTAQSPFPRKAYCSNPLPLFSNCTQKEVMTVRHCWTSLHKKSNCIPLVGKMQPPCLVFLVAVVNKQGPKSWANIRVGPCLAMLLGFSSNGRNPRQATQKCKVLSNTQLIWTNYSGRYTNRQKDRQTERQTDRQTDKQAVWLTDWKIYLLLTRTPPYTTW